MRERRTAVVCGVVSAALLLWGTMGCGGPGGPGIDSTDEHHAGDEQMERGPHGGRLLRHDDFALEVTIYERGVPPEFRIYAFEAGKPVVPVNVQLGITLRRFGARVDEIVFEPVDDYLRGTRTVDEPHSFDVSVVARHGGNTHRWEYPSYEGRVQLSPAAVTSSGIVIEPIAPGTIRTTVRANGRIAPNEDHLAHVIPRYPGVVTAVRKRLGDPVGAGEVLALVEGNETLQPYQVKSPLAGTVIAKDAVTGEFVGEGKPIYTVANLNTVWAELYVYPRDFALLQLGQAVSIEEGEGVPPGHGPLVYLSPFGAPGTQTLLARATIANAEGRWRPGLFVTGEILVGEAVVPTAIRATALQRFRDWDVVFLNVGDVFQAMPVVLGRRDAEWVEVLEGVEPGQHYAADNSFIIKAEIGKSGASHDH
jgi:membrane fusion protein, heavy metal efflux system